MTAASAKGTPPFPELIKALLSPAAYSHPVVRVEQIETHISVVLLAGAFAYKLKKPVDFGFLNFATLKRRHHFCLEEIRINRRLAPGLYRDVVPVCATETGLRFGGKGQPLEYAVRMRRFPRHAVLTETPVDRETIDRLAAQIAAFHLQLPPAPQGSDYGSPAGVLEPMLANVRVLRDSPLSNDNQTRIDQIEDWTLTRFQELEPFLRTRKTQGWIRECHGDLHRGNIALFDGQPLIFDAIEFNPDLRWIDCMSDIAFLAMDLRQIDQVPLERRLINAYLERTGDYAGLPLLTFYQVYRAMVRAKVCGIRLKQQARADKDQPQAIAELEHYLRIAQGYTRKRTPQVLITHGLSGSGKTWLGRALRERLPLIQIRSDVERKRLFGQNGAGIGSSPRRAPSQAELYNEDITQRTYRHLRQLAEQILGAGCSVLVDATCLRHQQRDLFRELAEQQHCPFTIVSLTASLDILKARVRGRLRQGNDASDADAAVVDRQHQSQDTLSPEEQSHTVVLDTQSPDAVTRFLRTWAQKADP